ncbi:spermatogenesis-associated protein 9-like [Acipenser ruthenus]|uniref:spermatogenesis-associated protein 9-like n=1 Tax=Acipenser ruthenus TaxID=7906 RepID=UPI0027421805|nr:spermatogenesis-associated protein 9-like [Acipenser ruthenus]
MLSRKIGWICGSFLKKFSGQASTVQKASLDILEEVKDKMPNIVEVPQSSQQPYESIVRRCRGLMVRALPKPGQAPVQQPRLSEKNTPAQLSMTTTSEAKHSASQAMGGKVSVLDLLSWPAKSAFSGMLQASYTVCMYLSMHFNRAMSLVRKAAVEEQPRWQSTERAGMGFVVSKHGVTARYYESKRQEWLYDSYGDSSVSLL